MIQHFLAMPTRQTFDFEASITTFPSVAGTPASAVIRSAQILASGRSHPTQRYCPLSLLFFGDRAVKSSNLSSGSLIFPMTNSPTPPTLEHVLNMSSVPESATGSSMDARTRATRLPTHSGRPIDRHPADRETQLLFQMDPMGRITLCFPGSTSK